MDPNKILMFVGGTVMGKHREPEVIASCALAGN